MKNEKWVFALVASLVASTAFAQTAPKSTSSPSGWRVQKNTDPMTDATSSTLVLAGTTPRTSLRVHCNDAGNYVLLLTTPKGLTETDPSMVELRFDKSEAQGYLLMPIQVASLVSSIGGSKTDANYAITTTSGGQKPGAPQVTEAGRDLVARIRNSSRLAYRLPLGEPAEGKTGAFDVRGFNRTDTAAGWRCGPSKPEPAANEVKKH